MGRIKKDNKPKKEILKVSTKDIDDNKTGHIVMCSYRDCPLDSCKRFHMNRELNILYLVEDFKPDKDNKCNGYL